MNLLQNENVIRVRRLLGRLNEELTWLAPALARLTCGVVFAASGWGKLHSLDNVTEFFTELGIPFPAEQALFVSALELVGGVALLLGLASRLFALPLMGTMAVALLTAKKDEIGSIGELSGQIEWTYLVLLAYILLAGPGGLSIDHIIARRFGQQMPRPMADQKP